MSMSMWVKFFRAPEDEDLKRKLDAAYACEKAGVMLPAELEHYFQPVLRKYGELPGNRSDAIDQMLSMGPEFKEQEKYKLILIIPQCKP